MNVASGGGKRGSGTKKSGEGEWKKGGGVEEGGDCRGGTEVKKGVGDEIFLNGKETNEDHVVDREQPFRTDSSAKSAPRFKFDVVSLLQN